MSLDRTAAIRRIGPPHAGADFEPELCGIANATGG
jgi:hypothetical protein